MFCSIKRSFGCAVLTIETYYIFVIRVPPLWFVAGIFPSAHNNKNPLYKIKRRDNDSRETKDQPFSLSFSHSLSHTHKVLIFFFFLLLHDSHSCIAWPSVLFTCRYALQWIYLQHRSETLSKAGVSCQAAYAHRHVASSSATCIKTISIAPIFWPRPNKEEEREIQRNRRRYQTVLSMADAQCYPHAARWSRGGCRRYSSAWNGQLGCAIVHTGSNFSRRTSCCGELGCATIIVIIIAAAAQNNDSNSNNNEAKTHHYAHWTLLCRQPRIRETRHCTMHVWSLDVFWRYWLRFRGIHRWYRCWPFYVQRTLAIQGSHCRAGNAIRCQWSRILG